MPSLTAGGMLTACAAVKAGSAPAAPRTDSATGPTMTCCCGGAALSLLYCSGRPPAPLRSRSRSSPSPPCESTAGVPTDHRVEDFRRQRDVQIVEVLARLAVVEVQVLRRLRAGRQDRLLPEDAEPDVSSTTGAMLSRMLLSGSGASLTAPTFGRTVRLWSSSICAESIDTGRRIGGTSMQPAPDTTACSGDSAEKSLPCTMMLARTLMREPIGARRRSGRPRRCASRRSPRS